MVKKHTKSDVASSRKSGGASLGSEYSNDACSNPMIISPGTTRVSPDASLNEAGTKRTPSVEHSDTKVASPLMLNSGDAIEKVMTEDASRQRLSKLLARSMEQVIYDSYVDLCGVRVANWLADTLDIFADHLEAIERLR